MKIGLCTISNKNETVRAVLSSAADAGYDGVEIWGDGHVGDGAEDAPEHVADTAAEVGLEIPVYGSYLRAGTDACEQASEGELVVAESLGASLIRVWAGAQEYQDHTAEHWDQVVDDLRTLSRRAANRGIGVTVEKHEGTLTNRTAGARELLEAVDHENCGLNYQPLFAYSADELVAEARELAPYTNNVHLQAVESRDTRDLTLLEDGYFDCGGVLEPFRNGSFSGYVEVEFVDPDRPYETAIRRDLEYLRSIVGDPTDVESS